MATKEKTVSREDFIKVVAQRDKLLEAVTKQEEKVRELEGAIEDQNKTIEHFKEKPTITNALVEMFTDVDPFKLISKKTFIFENMLYTHFREKMNLYGVKPAPSPVPVNNLIGSDKLQAYDQYVVDCKAAQEESEAVIYGIQCEIITG